MQAKEKPLLQHSFKGHTCLAKDIINTRVKIMITCFYVVAKRVQLNEQFFGCPPHSHALPRFFLNQYCNT